MADDERKPDGPADKEDLSPFWAIMRQMRGADELSPEEKAARNHPGELVIGTSKDRILVRIQPDGTIIYGEGYTPDEAAVELWTAIARKRPGFDSRLRHIDLLEMHIALIAEADLSYEAAQRAAKAEGATENDRFREDMSRANWETRVYGLIGFAREYAKMRPDLLKLVKGT